jgi:hypothetical protein
MTAPVAITIRFMNELPDHLETQRLLYKRTLLAKLDKVVAILLAGFGAYAVRGAGLRWWTLIWFPLAFLEWFDLLSLDRLRTRIWFRRNPKFREEYCLTFTRDCIHFQTASIDSTLQWTYYERVIESPTLFLLMYGKGLYTLIPKRCFPSEEQQSALRAMLQECIPATSTGH